MQLWVNELSIPGDDQRLDKCRVWTGRDKLLQLWVQDELRLKTGYCCLLPSKFCFNE